MGSSRPFSYSASKGSVEDATIAVKGGAGELNIGAGQRGVLVKMSGETPFDNPSLDVQRSGSTAEIEASLGSGPSVWPLTGRSRMDLKLSPEVTWDVQFETGAASLEADLRDVPTKCVASQDRRVFLGHHPGPSAFGALRSTGADRVRCRRRDARIPSDAEVRVEAQTGLSSVAVPSDVERLSESGRTYESPGYQNASGRYLIRVQTGLGSVDIRRY